jgi:hypothetical protein
MRSALINEVALRADVVHEIVTNRRIGTAAAHRHAAIETAAAPALTLATVAAAIAPAAAITASAIAAVTATAIAITARAAVAAAATLVVSGWDN